MSSTFCDELQWGRDPLIAEIWIAHEKTFSQAMLQWGRDPLIAEMAKHPAKRWVRQCFNGAAIR